MAGDHDPEIADDRVHAPVIDDDLDLEAATDDDDREVDREADRTDAAATKSENRDPDRDRQRGEAPTIAADHVTKIAG